MLKRDKREIVMGGDDGAGLGGQGGGGAVPRTINTKGLSKRPMETHYCSSCLRCIFI